MNGPSDSRTDQAASFLDRRSVLFLPASNPRAIAKARDSAADMVILDLEDAVKPGDKASARDAAAEALDEAWPMPAGIRINGEGTEWQSGDVDAAARSRAAFVVVPRVSSAHHVRDIAEATGKPILAMIETPNGVLASPEIARACLGLIAGTNDLRAELGIATSGGRMPIVAALQWIVLAARAAGVAAVDGVYNAFEDDDGFAAEAREGKSWGFTGKSLIHPRQIALCHAAFAPSQESLERARRLLAAYDGGAERFADEMIERMHVEAARRLIEEADRG